MIDLDLACIYTGGLLHLGWAVFHLLFPRLFKWGINLASLDLVNNGIMRIMNYCLTYYFLAVAFLSIYWAPELVDSYLGRQVLGLIAGFWLLRLGLQFSYFKASHPLSLVLGFLSLLSAAAYAFPLWYGA